MERSLFGMVGSRNVALGELIAQSDNFVRTVTGTLQSQTVAAHRDKHGKPVKDKTGNPVKKQCTPRQPRQLPPEGDDDEPDRDTVRVRDTARKRRRTDKHSNQTESGDVDGDDEDVCE